MCAKKVRSSLLKVDGLSDLTLVMKPASAHFTFDPDKESIQDLIRAVRGAGSEYDARLMVQSNADDDKLSTALRTVDGLRNPGSQDSKGIRLITFFLDKKTMYADIVTAATSIGAKLSPPIFENKEARQ